MAEGPKLHGRPSSELAVDAEVSFVFGSHKARDSDCLALQSHSRYGARGSPSSPQPLLTPHPGSGPPWVSGLC